MRPDGMARRRRVSRSLLRTTSDIARKQTTQALAIALKCGLQRRDPREKTRLPLLGKFRVPSKPQGVEKTRGEVFPARYLRHAADLGDELLGDRNPIRSFERYWDRFVAPGTRDDLTLKRPQPA